MVHSEIGGDGEAREIANTILGVARQKPVNLVVAPIASGKSETLESVAALAHAAGWQTHSFNAGFAADQERLERLIDDMSAPLTTPGRDRILIVIDDAHAATEALTSRAIALVQTVKGAALVAASDRPLAVRLASLRLQRKLAEYGLAELALNRHEMRHVARIGWADATSREFQSLMQATAGWVGAWRLIADRLADGESVRRVSTDFSGSFGHFADYFEEEILSVLDPEVAYFITRYGMISPLSVELADMLAGPDGRKFWEEARRQCPFLTHSGGSVRELNCHPMFRHFLAERARRLDPADYAATLRSAAGWFEGQREWPEVMECLIAAGDEEAVLSKLRENASEIFMRYGDVTLLLGKGFVSERVVREMAPVIRPETALIQRRLEVEGQGGAPLPKDASIADEYKAILTLFSSDRFDDLRPLAESWLLKERSDPVRRALVALMLAVACHVNAEVRAMRQALELGNAEIARSDSPFVETWLALEWAIYHLEGGRPSTARLAIETVLDRPSVRGLMRNTLEMVLAHVEYHLGRIDQATELIDRSLATGTRHATPETMVLGWATAALCAVKRSGLAEALAVLEGAYPVVARRTGERGRLSLRLVACQLCLREEPKAKLAFVQTELDHIQANAAPLALGRGFQEQVRMVAARLLYEQGELREATSLIQPILRRTEGTERILRWVEASIIRIAIATAEGRSALACRLFWECEAATTDAAVRRLFLDEAKLLRPTIVHLAQQVESLAFEPRHRTLVRDLSIAAGAGSAAVGGEEDEKPIDIKLTRIERRVIELVARGLSNKDISQRLSSSVATVKWHLSNIYIKLDVRSRTAALSRLQSLNLLS